MDTPKERLHLIENQIVNAVSRLKKPAYPPKLIAVSKRQGEAKRKQLLAAGHRHFGENQLQEAQLHWPALKEEYPDIMLHLIGPLQSNKVREAVALFDVIHTVDREKIALAIAKECREQRKQTPCLIQVNIGEESQKSGVLPRELPDFLNFCQEEAKLPITGLMAIPPAHVNPTPYFALMEKLANRHHLTELSMGMSSDFETAIRFGATYVRVGTALFGPRED